MNVSMHNEFITYPEIGFEHLLIFKTSKETMDENGEISKNIIKRRVQIIYTGIKGFLKKYQVFLFETECIFDHKLDPYTVLIRRLSYVFDECFIGVTQDGAIAEIFNVAFIQDRWKQIRSKLMQEHEGEIFDGYMKEIADRVKDHDSILNYLQQQSMYGLYFNGCWNNTIQSTQITDKKTVVEGNNYLLQEEIKVFPISSESADGCIIEVTGKGMNAAKYISVNGKYQYVTGILSEAKYAITTNSIKITHHASWVGLRKRL